MCFSAEQIRTWLRAERDAGLTVPVHLGVPGVIDKSKLMTMGMRLGVGTSLRYLSKNKKALGKLMTQRSFEPDALLRPLAADLEPFGIDGLHLYTFNQVDATETLARTHPGLTLRGSRSVGDRSAVSDRPARRSGCPPHAAGGDAWPRSFRPGSSLASAPSRA